MEGISGRYADTDSMFIHCRGFRREEAFAIGHRLERGRNWREFFRRADFGTVSGADYAETGESLPADTFSHEKTLRGVLLHQSNGGTFVGFVEAFHSSVEGKGIEMIRSDQCAYIHEITAETLHRVFQGCTEDSLRT